MAALLSAITGVLSYLHGLDISREVSTVPLAAYLLPLVPDLMIAMSSLVLYVASLVAPEDPRPAAAIGGLVAGIGWTVAQNVAAGWHQGWGGRLLDGGVPLALVLTFELLLWLVRKLRGRAASDAAAAALSWDEALQALVASEPERKLAALLRVDRNRIQGWKSQLAELAEPDPADAPEAGLVAAGA